MLLNMEDLYKPYSKDADLKTSLLYWKKEAAKLGISDDIMNSVVSETFLEMTHGKEFPVGSCDCGCEFPVEWSCVALNHYVLKKMVAKKSEIDQQVADILQKNITASILSLIEKKNSEDIKPHFLFDWDKSVVLNFFKAKDTS